jgi:hypothetical protein
LPVCHRGAEVVGGSAGGVAFRAGGRELLGGRGQGFRGGVGTGPFLTDGLLGSFPFGDGDSFGACLRPFGLGPCLGGYFGGGDGMVPFGAAPFRLRGRGAGDLGGVVGGALCLGSGGGRRVFG